MENAKIKELFEAKRLFDEIADDCDKMLNKLKEVETSVPELLKVCRALEPTLTDREILEKLKQAMAIETKGEE